MSGRLMSVIVLDAIGFVVLGYGSFRFFGEPSYFSLPVFMAGGFCILLALIIFFTDRQSHE